MSFGDPRLLQGLWLLPIVVLLEWLAARRGARALDRLIGARPGHVLLAQVRPRQRTAGAVLRVLAFALLVLGAARPEWGREVVRRGATGSDVAVVIDVSSSMDARDVPPSRLDGSLRCAGSPGANAPTYGEFSSTAAKSSAGRTGRFSSSYSTIRPGPPVRYART